MTSTSEQTEKKMTLWKEPTMRFLVELLTWGYLVLAGYWYLTILSMAMLSTINFRGDKKPADVGGPGYMAPGWARIATEFSFGVLGIWAAWLYLGSIGGIIQLILTLTSFFLDRKRWWWMLGKLPEPPLYVTYVHKTR
ncbi:MAG: hypothetical protein ACW98K_04775 [Candidatus Kariarchaeaceae archaeon]|jgi:hypothetical protein